MLGLVIGDIVASVYAFKPIKSRNFELFDINGKFTDDTVLAAGVANAMGAYQEDHNLNFSEILQEELLRISWVYQDMAYSRFFSQWMFEDEPKPYGSAGIVAASRALPIGFQGSSLEEVEQLAKLSAAITHSHEEGLKGAQCAAGCVFLAKQGKSKEDILAYAKKYYDLSFTLAGIRSQYQYIPTCPYALPPAIISFMEAEGFEEALRNVIFIGGGDSMAAITGALSEAFYGVPEELAKTARNYLDEEILSALD